MVLMYISWFPHSSSPGQWEGDLGSQTTSERTLLAKINSTTPSQIASPPNEFVHSNITLSINRILRSRPCNFMAPSKIPPFAASDLDKGRRLSGCTILR